MTTKEKAEAYDLLVDFLIEDGVYTDGICDALCGMKTDGNGDDWCLRHCDGKHCPDKECFAQFCKYLKEEKDRKEKEENKNGK